MFLFYICYFCKQIWTEYILTKFKIFLWEKNWPFSLISGLKIRVSCLPVLLFVSDLSVENLCFHSPLFPLFSLCADLSHLPSFLTSLPRLVLPFQIHPPLFPLPIALTRSAHFNERLRKGGGRWVRWKSDEQESKSWSERWEECEFYKTGGKDKTVDRSVISKLKLHSMYFCFFILYWLDSFIHSFVT